MKSNFLAILGALFKNQLRTDGKKSGRIAVMVAIGLLYVFVMAMAITVLFLFKPIFTDPSVPEQTRSGLAVSLYFGLLVFAAVFVLIFGIIKTVSTLFLSKDTDFYSTLPVKPSTVFLAKFAFVYCLEAVISVAITLPIMIVFGIVAKMWVGYYFITVLSIVFVPALPLMVATIIAVPVMFLASKMKNRNIVVLILYMLLYFGFFGLYFYFIYNVQIDMTSAENFIDSLSVVKYVLFPYTALSQAACAMSAYGLPVGGAVAVNFAIFLGITAALFALIFLLCKFMYGRSVSANNQTDNSKVKKGEFKSQNGTRALIKREYVSALRNTQTAFQCFAVFLLPVFMAFILTMMLKDTFDLLDGQMISVMLFSLGAVLCTTTTTPSSTTFSREGTGGMQNLKVLPIDIKRMLMSKIVAWAVPAAVGSALYVAVVGVMYFNAVDFACGLVLYLVAQPIFVVFTTLWDLRKPKLNWTDPLKAVKQNMNAFFGQMFIMLAFMAIMIIGLVVSIKTDFGQIVFWICMYCVPLIFGVLDVVLAKNAKSYYARIEL